MMEMLIMHTASGNFTIHIFTILSFIIHGITIPTIIHPAGPFHSVGDGAILITDMAILTTDGVTHIMDGDIRVTVGVIIHLITGDILDITLQFMLILTIINTDKEDRREPM
jgi:hypothetical protein